MVSVETNVVTLQDTENLLHFVIPEPPRLSLEENSPGVQEFGGGCVEFRAGCIGGAIDTGCLSTLIGRGCLL